MSDPNYNVIGVVNESGRQVERYEYTPYGQRTIYGRQTVLTDVQEATSWANDAMLTYPQLTSARIVSTIPVTLCDFGHQGLMHDLTGLIGNRARMYSPDHRVFMQHDRMRYANLYQYCRSDPIGYRDWNGWDPESQPSSRPTSRPTSRPATPGFVLKGKRWTEPGEDGRTGETDYDIDPGKFGTKGTTKKDSKVIFEGARILVTYGWLDEEVKAHELEHSEIIRKGWGDFYAYAICFNGKEYPHAIANCWFQAMLMKLDAEKTEWDAKNLEMDAAIPGYEEKFPGTTERAEAARKVADAARKAFDAKDKECSEMR